jgi:Flp pilus assembly protein TadG
MMHRNDFQRLHTSKQQGVVIIVVLLGLVAILGMVGLALDGGHTMVTKTRLQNIVDAAALSAAKTLDRTDGDVVAAQAEALAMFADAADDLGHAEINEAYNASDFNVLVEFSNTLMPFTPGTVPAEYVRVSAQGYGLPTALLGIAGVTETDVGATAIAGPSVTLWEICNVAPMMVCGDGSGADNYHGFKPGEVSVMKAGSANQDMEKGNFQLIRLDGSTGGADVRSALAGTYDNCIVPSDGIETEPGNTVGPVAQGMNTRLGIYTGPMSGTEAQHPSDVFTTQPAGEFTDEWVDTDNDGVEDDWVVHYDGQPVEYGTPDVWDAGDPLDPADDVFYHSPQVDNGGVYADLEGFYSYEDYHAQSSAAPASADPTKKLWRRRMALPIASCGNESGQSTLDYQGVLCFFLVQEVDQGNDPDVFGQFTPEGCEVTGKPGPFPLTGPGPYRIQLYKDTDGYDS